jgi:hypothetical protein
LGWISGWTPPSNPGQLGTFFVWNIKTYLFHLFSRDLVRKVQISGKDYSIVIKMDQNLLLESNLVRIDRLAWISWRHYCSSKRCPLCTVFKIIECSALDSHGPELLLLCYFEDYISCFLQFIFILKLFGAKSRLMLSIYATKY